MKLILLRHGESQWNLENRFTGWKDVDLTDGGINEAEFSGQQLLKKNITIDTLHTSLLLRATNTAKIVADIISFNKENIKYDWRLNERHYGALEGLNKSETAAKYGEDQVHIWRRSYDISPPPLSDDDERHPKFNAKFKNIDGDLPIGESLKNVIDRLNPFWQIFLKKMTNVGGNHLIIAHSNSLRAIVMIVEKMKSNEIMNVNLPTGVPLIYNLDKNGFLIDKKFLIDDNSLNSKINLIKNQGKVI